MKLPNRFLVLCESPEHSIEIHAELIKRGIDFLGGDGKPKRSCSCDFVYSINPFNKDGKPKLFFGPKSQYANSDIPYLTLDQIKEYD